MMDKELIIEKAQCSGCGACQNRCPQKAISMKTDSCGFVYPHILSEICTNCGVCQTVCEQYSIVTDYDFDSKCYFGQAKDRGILEKAASGGIFSVLANAILERNGVVFGASLSMRNGRCTVSHQYILTSEELNQLQGSKYVQSEIGLSYTLCKKFLDDGKQVLFSGVPCQVAGLKAYLGREYSNLYLVDVICHGVPNQEFFQKYLNFIQKSRNFTIEDISFRNKERGWGFKGKLIYITKRGKRKSMVWNSSVDSYYRMFLKGETYRPSCYQCKFACPDRVSDITLGDFWGFESVYTKKVKQNNLFYPEKGISCVLINSEKGQKIFSEIKSNVIMLSCTFDDVSKENDQLKQHSRYPADYETVKELMSQSTYMDFELYFRKRMGFEFYYRKLIGLIPYSIKKRLKNSLQRKSQAEIDEL